MKTSEKQVAAVVNEFTSEQLEKMLEMRKQADYKAQMEIENESVLALVKDLKNASNQAERNEQLTQIAEVCYNALNYDNDLFLLVDNVNSAADDTEKYTALQSLGDFISTAKKEIKPKGKSTYNPDRDIEQYLKGKKAQANGTEILVTWAREIEKFEKNAADYTSNKKAGKQPTSTQERAWKVVNNYKASVNKEAKELESAENEANS